MSVRTILFWTHLIVGVVVGVVILILCITGAAIAFDKEAASAADPATRIAEGAPDAMRLPVDDLISRAAGNRPGSRPTSITLHANPDRAAVVSFGRNETSYVNPYTGAVTEQGARLVRGLMRTLTEWHRWLGRDGEGRAVGKAITGAGNVAFLFLAVSGLILWAPRRLSLESLKAVTCFRWKLRGKARDWNWHTVLGFWSSPLLIVLTVTGMVISYRWAGNLVYTVAGSPPPAAGSGPGGSGAAPVQVPPAGDGVRPLRYDALVAFAAKEAPRWDQITLRLPSSDRPDAGLRAERRGEGAQGAMPPRRWRYRCGNATACRSSAACSFGWTPTPAPFSAGRGMRTTTLGAGCGCGCDSCTPGRPLACRDGSPLLRLRSAGPSWCGPASRWLGAGSRDGTKAAWSNGGRSDCATPHHEFRCRGGSGLPKGG